MERENTCSRLIQKRSVKNLNCSWRPSKSASSFTFKSCGFRPRFSPAFYLIYLLPKSSPQIFGNTGSVGNIQSLYRSLGYPSLPQGVCSSRADILFYFYLTYSRWTSSLPSWLWSLRIFPSLPGSRLTTFLSRYKSSNLTTRQRMVKFYLLTFPRFPLRKKEHKSYFGKNRTHDYCTSRCAGYLPDHSGENCRLLQQEQHETTQLARGERSRDSNRPNRARRDAAKQATLPRHAAQPKAAHVRCFTFFIEDVQDR